MDSLRVFVFITAALMPLALHSLPASAATYSAKVQLEMGSDAEFMQNMAETQGQAMPEAYKEQKQEKDKREGRLYWGEGWLRLDVKGGKGRPGGSWLYDEATRSLYELKEKQKTYYLDQLEAFSDGKIVMPAGMSSQDWLILRWAEFFALEEAEGLSVERLGDDEMEGFTVSGVSISAGGGMPEIPGGLAGMQGMEGMEGLEGYDMGQLQGMFDIMGSLDVTIWASEELNAPLAFGYSRMGMETVFTLSEIEETAEAAELLQLPEDYTLEQRNDAGIPAGF